MLKKKELLKSLELIEKSIAADDEQPLSLMAAAKIYLRFKMYDKAADAALKSYSSNKKYLDKNVSHAQNILMNEKELCSHGLEIAITSSNRGLFNFFYEKFTALVESGNLEASVFNKLYNNINIDDSTIKTFIAGISEHYLDALLILVEKYNYVNTRLKILNALSVKYNKNPYIHLQLGKHHLTSGNIKAAQTELEKTVKLSPDEPSFYFYLISVYMQNADREKVLLTLETLEKKFSLYPEVKSKIDILKQKLVSHLS